MMGGLRDEPQLENQVLDLDEIHGLGFLCSMFYGLSFVVAVREICPTINRQVHKGSARVAGWFKSRTSKTTPRIEVLCLEDFSASIQDKTGFRNVSTNHENDSEAGQDEATVDIDPSHIRSMTGKDRKTLDRSTMGTEQAFAHGRRRKWRPFPRGYYLGYASHGINRIHGSPIVRYTFPSAFHRSDISGSSSWSDYI